MRRDSIFYKLFQQCPNLLFQLIATPPTNADAYRFDSVAVKEPKFEIDGVFLPPENEAAGVVYFCEVQFKKDEQLYERVFAESSLYFYRNRAKFSDWQVVIIYLCRSVEQSDIYPHRNLLNGNQVHRVFLDELGDIRQLPLWVALMVLTTIEEEQAPQTARYLLNRTNEEASAPTASVIIEMITTIMMYRFEQLNRREVESMLGITLKQTRVYQEIKEEIEDEVRQKAEQEAKAVMANAICRQLAKRLGELSHEIRSSISALPLPALADLSDALLDFTSLADLSSWLEAQQK